MGKRGVKAFIGILILTFSLSLVCTGGDGWTQIISIVKKKAGGGTATITREGFAERVLSDSETEIAWTVTIPASTTAIVITSHACAFWSGNPLVSADLNGTQNFTVDANIDPASDAGVGIGHLFSPGSTGLQTINVTVGSHGYEGYLYVIYYSGTATDGIRDSDAVGGTSLTLTTQSGDMVVSAATDADNTSISWTNATEIDEYAAPATYGIAIAQTAADGTSETVSTSGSNVGLVAIVLKPAAL